MFDIEFGALFSRKFKIKTTLYVKYSCTADEEFGVEPKVDGLGDKWMVISHEGVKVDWVKVTVHS